MASSSAVAKLEPFLLMAKSAKGAAATKLIESATAAPGVFVFAELLDSPNVQQLAENPQLAAHLSLLQLFSYGTYSDYLQHKSTLPPLNAAQTTKLKQLSIITLAADRRILPYSQLLTLLEIPSVRALEDLIIDAIYAELVRGKLDQKNQQFEVQYTLGRDLRPGQLDDLLGALKDWSNRTASVLSALDDKLAEIDATERQKKDHLLAYDLNRQHIADELVAAATQARTSGGGGGSKRGAFATLNQQGQPGFTNNQNQNQGGYQNAQYSVFSGPGQTLGGASNMTLSQLQFAYDPEDNMDVDPSPVAPPSPSKKKPSSSASASGGGGQAAAARKRPRAGSRS